MHQVRVGSLIKTLALGAILAVSVTGCGGIAATPTFSPLMFFLPGLAKDHAKPRQIVPLKQDGSPAQVIASNRDSAKVN